MGKKTGTKQHHKHEAYYLQTLPAYMLSRMENYVDDVWVEILESIGKCRMENKCWIPKFKPPAKPHYVNYAAISEHILAMGKKNEKMAAAGRRGAKHKQKPKQ